MSNKSRALISSIVLGIIFATVWHFAFISYAETGSALAYGFMLCSIVSGIRVIENVERHYLGKPQMTWDIKTIVVYPLAGVIMTIVMAYLSSTMKTVNDTEILMFGYSSMTIPTLLLECMTYFICREVFSSILSSGEEKVAETEEQ